MKYPEFYRSQFPATISRNNGSGWRLSLTIASDAFGFFLRHLRRRLKRRSKPEFLRRPELGYTLHKPIKNWDEKRTESPSFFSGSEERVIFVSVSQPFRRSYAVEVFQEQSRLLPGDEITGVVGGTK
ncbi:hypothetical protein R6Q59_000250, partial [Mikania micrantha]